MKPLLIAVLMVSCAGMGFNLWPLTHADRLCSTVGTHLYLSDVMEHMTEPEADALIRAVQAARG